MTVTIRVEAGWRHVPRDGLHPSSSSIEPCTPRTALPMKPVMATVAASRSPDDLRQVHRQGMWRALEGLPRYIATPTVAKHRLFVWLDARICPDHQLIVIARDDDTTFGILHSRFHEVWSLSPRHESGKPSSVYAHDDLRDLSLPGWTVAGYSRCRLPEWVEWVQEPVPGYPKRPVRSNKAATKQLRQRTLTHLYNARPQWLADARATLDSAVAATYGWTEDISDDDALRDLLALNLAS